MVRATVRAVTMQREFTRSDRRLMEVKINDRKGRNHDATAGRNHCGEPSQPRLSPRYFFFSILVTVSPDGLAVKLT